MESAVIGRKVEPHAETLSRIKQFAERQEEDVYGSSG